ncbi:hypothetical protein [Porphyromonas circumdentaria]|nr:hypothetical protein [Porphyromonas circumdentaria]MDO4722827.1 hypothetical protein [Porphyromonas circumdentaria]
MDKRAKVDRCAAPAFAGMQSLSKGEEKSLVWGLFWNKRFIYQKAMSLL